MVFVKDTGHSTAFCQCLDKSGISGALFTDLSKAFDCLLHELSVAKLAAYDFDYESLAFIQSYLYERQQRTKVNETCSTYSKILYSVPQGYILGSLLFNIYISDMFYSLINGILPAMLTTTFHTPVTLT